MIASWRRAALLAGFVLLCHLAAPAPARAEDCPSAGGLSFICGIKAPEDLAALPKTRWLIVSGMAKGSGLHLVDAESKSWERWTAAPPAAPSKVFHDCAEPPKADELVAHGLSLRPAKTGRYTLYVVNHGGRETIEVFEVDARKTKPGLSWVGCVAMPAGLAANSVAAAPDGTIFATVLLHPGMSFDDVFAGHPTGAVYQWRPGSTGFARVWGTELAGDNGIEVSPDGKTLYVALTGGQVISVLSNTNPAKVLRTIATPEFSPDNVHWVDGRLMAAGMTFDEPACGGPIKSTKRSAEVLNCPRGYSVVSIDTAADMAVKVVAKGAAVPGFSGVATGLVVGSTVWLGSFGGDKVAYRSLP